MQSYSEKLESGTTKSMQYIVAVAVVFCALTLSMVAPARAASVSYALNQSNRLSDGQNYLNVTMDDEGAAGMINFEISILSPLSDLVACDFGIQAFGFNGIDLRKNNIVGLPDGWSLKHDKKMDSFGKFENVLVGNISSLQSPLTFSITGISADNLSSYATGHESGDGFFFAAYVSDSAPKNKHRKCDSCDFDAHFAGDTIVPTTVVPVPAAIWLFGSGLLIILGFRRQK